MKPAYWILSGVALTLGLVVGSAYTGYQYGKSRAELRTASIWLESAEVAHEIERKQQKGVNDALRKQNETLSAINARRVADIERLQHRTNRAELSRTARAECQGVTGSELSRQDAGVLIGEAARADEIRAGLIACYSTLDTIAKGAE